MGLHERGHGDGRSIVFVPRGQWINAIDVASRREENPRELSLINVASSITDTDNGYEITLFRIEKASRGYSGVVGVFGDAAGTEHNGAAGLTVGEIALAHELGMGVPERSWLRSWFDENKTIIQDDMRRITEGHFRGKDLGIFLAQLAALYAGEIQQRIADGEITPDIEQATKDAKGSDIPLIDTGQLRSAITWALEQVAGKKISATADVSSPT